MSKNDSYKRFHNMNPSLIEKETEENVDSDFVFKHKPYEIE